MKIPYFYIKMNVISEMVKLYMLHGLQKIGVLGKCITGSLFGTIDAIPGKFICTKADTCNAESFQEFLNCRLKEYENKHVVLVLDNAKYHYVKISKYFLRKNNSRLTLPFLPPYSPNLNRIERVGEVMKENVLANCYHETMKHLMDSIY